MVQTIWKYARREKLWALGTNAIRPDERVEQAAGRETAVAGVMADDEQLAARHPADDGMLN
jgi:hypothetical protein